MILHQRQDFVWEMRENSGAFLAMISWNETFSLYHVSFGDMESEFFRSFSEACAYAERGGA